MSARVDTPRDLLFGLLALQAGLVDQSALVQAFHAWTRAKDRPMADLLVERGAIDLDQRPLLEGLAAHHLKKHGDDPESSLAAVGVGPSTRLKLAAIEDPDLLDSLATAGLAVATDDYPLGAAGHAAVGATNPGGQRFRILRPHARGGLGEVFVALDAELNREVALKQILDRHAFDPAHHSKFLVEAEITGGLEHPGIVPVYGLGHHDDGRPYYAMRFIRGDNLKEAIERFHADDALKADPAARSLALRKLLRRFTDVCNAIEYAHSRGVLHRDIKPGNVIVGKYGETLVVDWGLAKARGRPGGDPTGGEQALSPASASGSAETLPGRALGTPAYMSPEQAAGDLDRLGPPSDVYGLGATLYTLLTGRVAFEGDVLKVLRDVEAGRFPRPRAVDPSIDPAIEALCLKAMAKAPGDRYASPRALADDIDRWAADEPIAAYAEPLARRARRWARRNRTAVTAAAASLLVALVGLASTLAVQSKANADLGAKNELLTKANAREIKANVDLNVANDRVQARFDLARQAIRSFSRAVNDDEVLKDDRLRSLRDKLLRSAADFHDQLGRLLEGQPDRRSRQALADSYFDLGELTRTIGDQRVALESHRKSLALRRSLAETAAPGVTLDLARSLYAMAYLLDDTGDSEAALGHYREALGQAEEWPTTDPSADARPLIGTIHNDIGYLLSRAGEPSRALEAYGRALAIREGLAAANPAVTQYRSDLAESLNNIGALLADVGEPARALESYGRALAIQEALASANPAVNVFLSDLALSHNNIGALLGRAGEPARALESHRKALSIREALASANPAVNEFRSRLAESHNNIGALLAGMGDPSRALESYGRALAIREALASTNPTIPAYQSDRYQSQIGLGLIQDRLAQFRDAVVSLRRGIALGERLARDPKASCDLAGYQARLAGAASRPGSGVSAEEARAEADRAVAMLRRAVAGGVRDARQLQGDGDFDPIRSRGDFQDLVMDLAFPDRPFAP